MGEKSIRVSRSPYDIELHQHRFAAWAAGRAASVKGCRFSVAQGRYILERSFISKLSKPEQLPRSRDVDAMHRQWRNRVIAVAKRHNLKFTDGVAAKLINVYLKCRFVCGGHHGHENVRNLHPPIDDVLLKTLAEQNYGGFAKYWRDARKKRWSKLNAEEYEGVIRRIREALKGEPLWTIEEYWKGNQ